MVLSSWALPLVVRMHGASNPAPSMVAGLGDCLPTPWFTSSDTIVTSMPPRSQHVPQITFAGERDSNTRPVRGKTFAQSVIRRAALARTVS